MRSTVGDIHLLLFDPKDVPDDLRDCFEEVETICGAPWERVTERSGGTIGKGWTDHSADIEQGMNQVRYPGGVGNAKDENGKPYQVVTLTWQPTCTCHCPAADPAPATVLEPFAGAATTLLVADRLGRDGIGIELNPEYVAMGEDRIRGDAPMFAQVDVVK